MRNRLNLTLQLLSPTMQSEYTMHNSNLRYQNANAHAPTIPSNHWFYPEIILRQKREQKHVKIRPNIRLNNGRLYREIRRSRRHSRSKRSGTNAIEIVNENRSKHVIFHIKLDPDRLGNIQDCRNNHLPCFQDSGECCRPRGS